MLLFYSLTKHGQVHRCHHETIRKGFPLVATGNTDLDQKPKPKTKLQTILNNKNTKLLQFYSNVQTVLAIQHSFASNTVAKPQDQLVIKPNNCNVIQFQEI